MRWTRHSAEERAVAFGLEGLNRLVGQGRALRLEAVEASEEVDEGEGEVEGGGEGFEDASAGGDDFAADAVAGNEADAEGARGGHRERRDRASDKRYLVSQL